MDFGKCEKVTREDVTKFRHSLGIDDQTPLVGGVFRLVQEKRPLDFIAVVERVKKEVQNVRAVVAGTGALEREIEQHIRRKGLMDTITLLGRRSDIFVMMKSCDVLLHTADREGTPNVIMEAQSIGVPVVATMVGGIPEVVETGISGLLHSIGDVENLAESLVRVLRDKAYGRNLGEAGKRVMTERFSIDRIANDLSNIYYGKPDVRYSSKIDALYYRLIGLFLPIMRHLKLLVQMPRLTILFMMKRLRLALNKRITGVLTEIRHEEGHCYYAQVQGWVVPDVDGYSSSLTLFENGVPLTCPHSFHDDIRSLGGGRFCHYGYYIYFSTSDNSDPRTNGRTYSFSE
jgi:hypothetical protein